MHVTTISGAKFDFDAPRFDLRDIAHALGNIRRFNGHTNAPWTVRQHSLACNYYASKARKREALLHDACEAYLSDVPTPLKRMLPDYQALEARIDRAMRAAFNLPLEMTQGCREIDETLFHAEAYEFHPKLWVELGEPTVDHLAWKAIQRAKNEDSLEIFITLAGAHA